MEMNEIREEFGKRHETRLIIALVADYGANAKAYPAPSVSSSRAWIWAQLSSLAQAVALT
jgi:hypothetical protein